MSARAEDGRPKGLISVSAVQAGRYPGLVASEAQAVRLVFEWVLTFLCRPHSDLGRTGPVCPWAKVAVEKGLLWFCPFDGSERSESDVDSRILELRDWFRIAPPVSGDDAQFKTVLMPFPELPPERWEADVDDRQRRLKAEFVPQGLMIGQFHARSEEPGVHNPAFRPLRAPVPMLVIRSLVPQDIAFMNTAEFRAAFAQRFPDKSKGVNRAA